MSEVVEGVVVLGDDEDTTSTTATASLVVWIGLIAMAAASFWSQAVVTEERFVPALNVISLYFRIPDDIAGATLMAAGASSPELFSSFVALFITHSALGLGTVFGSEVFNQLIICAGAVYSSHNGRLELDKAVVSREVFFYALGILALYTALQDVRPAGDGSGEDHIYVSFGQAWLVVGGYVFYVLVCANMDAVVQFVTRCSGGSGAGAGAGAAGGPTTTVPTTTKSELAVPQHQHQEDKTTTTIPNSSSSSTGVMMKVTAATGSSSSSSSTRYGAIDVEESLPFLLEKSASVGVMMILREPIGNFETVEYFRTKTGTRSRSSGSIITATTGADDTNNNTSSHDDSRQSGTSGVGAGAGTSTTTTTTRDNQLPPVPRRSSSIVAHSIRSMVHRFSDGATLRPFQFLMTTEKPSDEHTLDDIEFDEYEERMSCFLYQRSYFYSNARFATKGWHLRWFSFSPHRVVSVPDRMEYERHKIQYPPFTQVVVDPHRLIIKIICAPAATNNTNQQQQQQQASFYFLAPSQEILDHVVERFSFLASHYQQGNNATDAAALKIGKDGLATATTTTNDANSKADDPAVKDEQHEDLDEESLIRFPIDGTSFGIVFFVLLFPLRLAMHCTVPDVRRLDATGTPNASLSTAMIACIMCLVWLIVGSYAMVASLEALAELMNIPDTVIGYTVSAAGTSLPNYVASAVAARNGFGNMAVSNALGSNTFNIMIALGLPWVLYIAFGTHLEPYKELKDEGITEGVLIMAGVLLLLVLLLLQSGFVLYMWHGHLFVATYIAYLVYVIGGVYWW